MIEVLIDDRMKVEALRGKKIRFTVSWGLKVGDKEYVQTTRGCLAGWGANGKYWLLPTLRSGPKVMIKPTSVSPDVYNAVLEELERMRVFDDIGPDETYFVKLPVEKTEIPEEKSFLLIPSPHEARQRKIRCG